LPPRIPRRRLKALLPLGFCRVAAEKTGSSDSRSGAFLRHAICYVQAQGHRHCPAVPCPERANPFSLKLIDDDPDDYDEDRGDDFGDYDEFRGFDDEFRDDDEDRPWRRGTGTDE